MEPDQRPEWLAGIRLPDLRKLFTTTAKFIRQRPVVIALPASLALVAGLMAVFFLPQQAEAATRSISIKNFAFQPETVNAAVGDTIVWTNNETDGTQHDILGGPFDSPVLNPGASYRATASQAGTYQYVCEIHSYMTGTIVVGGGGTPTQTPTTTPTQTPTSTPTQTPTTTPTTTPTSTPTTTPTGTPTSTTPPQQGEDLHDGTFLAPYEVKDGWKVFTLTAAPLDLEVSKGVVKKAYAFNGIVPGPVIRVNEGDKVRIVVKNELPKGTSVHWHGMQLPNNQDGVPGVTQPMIEPGESYTYEWKAITTGSHWYHSHMDGEQVGRGLYGSLEVVPRLGDIRADHDYRVMVSDSVMGFLLNGRSFPATKPLRARVGESVRIRVIGTGPEQIHPMHLHGGEFTVVAQDGRNLSAPYQADTINVGVGQTYDILFTPREPGHWLFHCHIFSHSETANGMTGLVTTVEVDPPALSLPLPLAR